MRKYNKIAIFVGHSILKTGEYTCAIGIKNEYEYNKQLAREIAKLFNIAGQACDVIIVPEYRYNSGYEDDYKLPIANSGRYDLIMELHLNHYDGKANGTEVICYPKGESKEVALRVRNNLATKFHKRDLIETRDKFYMIRSTTPPAIMIESFFCDSAKDCSIADELGVAGVAKLIAEGVLDTTINTNEGFTVGDYHKKVKITASSLNVRTGRGTDHPVINTFKNGYETEIWYIWYEDGHKGDNKKLWGSCHSGKYDENGKPITGFIHLGYVERV